MLDIFEQGDFSILDIENLRLHYARTLEHWLNRFEEHSDQVREMFDERFVRMWRLYLCASISAFRFGSLQLFQVLFAHGTNNQIPMTRQDLYTTSVSSLPAEQARINGKKLQEATPTPNEGDQT
jgi:cyclopropane-fatty-acyl-phospholipid synthase